METNNELVDYLVEKERIKSANVEKAFREVDRGDFTPDRDHSHREGEAFLDVERNPYLDEVYPMKEESTISQPSVVAQMIELLDLEEDDEILEIGSGSGYQIALISRIAERAVGVELDREVAEYSRQKLRDYENVEIVHGNGFDKVKSSFDKIIFACAITEEKMEEAKEHLNEGGIIVAPIGQNRVQEITVYDDSKSETYRNGKVQFINYKE